MELQQPSSGAGSSGVITLDELRARCETLLSAFVAEGGSRELAAAHAPGGTENSDVTVFGWLQYFKQLNRLHAVASGQTLDGSTKPSTRRAEVDAALTDSLSEKPISVELQDGSVRQVHPKSFHALAFLTSLDRQHQLDAEASAVASQLLTREDLQVYAIAPLANSLARRLWLWILTSSGAGLPFDDEGLKPAVPPKWTQLVTPEDILKFTAAHIEIHQRRLSIISNAFPSETNNGDSGLPLSGFIGTVAAETGQDARDLMRRHSLGKIFATAVSRAETERIAHQRAKEKAA